MDILQARFLSKIDGWPISRHSAKTTVHDKHRALRFVVFFAAVWIATFTAAFMNGDDVIHMSKNDGWGFFLPTLNYTWIPNRVFDLYGRSLIAAVFDFVYFPLKAALGVDFYWAYKFFSATVFAGFLTIVYRYVLGTLSTARPRSRDVLYVEVLSIFLAAILVTTFPWVNQVHFICYQLPAFLSLVLLTELSRLAADCLASGRPGSARISHAMGRHNYSSIFFLAFLCAFSLEAYAATILIALMMTWAAIATIWLYQSHRVERAKPDALTREFQLFAHSSLWTSFFCIVALLLTVRFSGRAEGGTASSFISNLARLRLSVLRENEAIRLFAAYGETVSTKFLLVLTLFGIVFFQVARVVNKRSALAVKLKPRQPSGRFNCATSLVMGVSATVVCLSSFIVAAAASAKSGRNYFSHANYPWGDLLLPAKLTLILFVVMGLNQIHESLFWIRKISLLVMFVISSACIFNFVNASRDAYRRSILVENAYRAATAVQSNRSDTIESGLLLESIPMQIRPLPSKDCADHFILAYKTMFAKYYGVNDAPLFR
jgi:hypothetical protein